MHQRFFELHARSALFLDEVREHDDVAHDDAGEANDADQRHEAERRVACCEADEGSNESQRHGEHHDERFHHRAELNHHRQRDERERDLQHALHLALAVRQFSFFTTECDAFLRKMLAGLREDARGELTEGRECFHGDRALLVDAREHAGVIMHFVSAGLLQCCGDLRSLRVQLFTADLDLDGCFERRSLLDLFHQAKPVLDLAIEDFAQMYDECGHVPGLAAVHKHLRNVRRGLSGQYVVVKHRRAAATDNDGALDRVFLLQEVAHTCRDSHRLFDGAAFGQLDVHQELVAFGGGKELLPEKRNERRAGREQTVGGHDGEKRLPQRKLQRGFVEGHEAMHRMRAVHGIETLLAFQDVVAEQRDEGHRHDARRHERERDDDGQRDDECAHVPRQQRERQEGDDVDECAEEDRATQLERSQPCCDAARLAVGEFTIDAIRGHHRVIHEHAE